MNKNELRKIIKGSLRDLTVPYKTTADKKISATILKLDEYKDAETVFVFVGTDDEIDTEALIDTMLMDGKTVCVPLCKSPGKMEARKIESRDELAEGKYGIMEPIKSTPVVKPQEIDFAIIPCVTCNKKGQRLGHGGGYYDRYFEKLDTKTAIICREETMMAAIPTEAHDVTFDMVISERQIYRNESL